MKFGLTRELVSEVTAADAMTFTLQMREFRHRERWSLLPRISQKQSQYFHESACLQSCVLKYCASVAGQIKNSSHIFTKISKVCVCLLSLFSRVQLSVTIWTIAYQGPHPWDSPGKNTGVGCQALLQGIFPTQGLNLHHLRLLD